MPVINPIPSNINTIINEAIRLYGELPQNIGIETEYSTDMPLLSIDPEQMRRAFFNIIKNAIEAMYEGGKLSISTQKTEANIDNHSKEYIQIDFMDTGTGIPEELSKELFSPHFSTKKGGAGLGVAIVKKIVTDHGGDIYVKSEEGKGTVFTINIPV